MYSSFQYERYTNAELKISLYVPVHIKIKFVIFLKSRLLFDVFYCFCMFINI